LKRIAFWQAMKKDSDMDIPLRSVSSVPYSWDYGAYAEHPGICR
jgi:hypothetical protein